MKLSTSILALVICLLVSTCFVTNIHALSMLGKDIQKELDVNPFLKKEGIKLRVADEEAGYVTIEMFEGNKDIREAIDEGLDVFNQASAMMMFGESKEEANTFKALTRSLGYIKEMKGVKDLMITAAINTPADQVEDEKKEALRQARILENKGYKLHNEKKYQEADKYFKQALGFSNNSPQNELVKNLLAWKYAVQPNYQLIDQDLALKFATELINLDSQNASAYLDTLAAVYARLGNFDKAIEIQKMAVSKEGSNNDDFKLRLELYQKSQPYTESLSLLGQKNDWYKKGRELFKHGEYKEALIWFSEAANEGHTGSMLAIGYLYNYGLGTESNLDKAFDWYQKASELNNPIGTLGLGACYLGGKGVQQNYERAVQLFDKLKYHEDTYVRLNAYAFLAWIYSTSKDEEYLDREKAKEYATLIETDKLNHIMLASKAAASARNEQFEDAIIYQKEALNRLEDYHKPRYGQKYNFILKLYKDNQPYTEEFKFN